MKELMETLGYSFQNEELLRQALTLACGSHRAQYERLEFLGDRVLGLVIATLLLEKYPQEREGDIARRFTSLVKEDTLAQMAGKLNLKIDLITDNLDLKKRPSVLADVVEAILGAVYLDSGFEKAFQVVKNLYKDALNKKTTPPVDPKTQLQEWAHKNIKSTPIYELVSKTGPEHALVFEVSVSVGEFEPVKGVGTSKRAAEKQAAESFLKKMGIKHGS